MYVSPVTPSEADRVQHLTDAVKPAVLAFADKLEALASWDKAAISAAIKETIAAHGLKMPQLAIPVRVLACGRAQTPSVDAVLELFDKEILLNRLRSV
jgi:glutamyl-tRNA synthetase